MEKNLKSGIKNEDFHFPTEVNSSLGSFENGGAIITDVEGNEYINMSESNGNDVHSVSIDLAKRTERFIASLKAITNMYPVKVQVTGIGFALFFHKRNPESFAEMKEFDSENAIWFYRSLLKEGVCFTQEPNSFNFISEDHSDKQLRLVIIAVQRALSYVYGYVDNM